MGWPWLCKIVDDVWIETVLDFAVMMLDLLDANFGIEVRVNNTSMSKDCLIVLGL